MKISAVRTLVLGTDLAKPISTSFGTMTKRYMILVNVQTDEGLEGWGESWSNFPAWAPSERIHTIHDGLAPLVIGENPIEVKKLHKKMRAATRILERQWGAPGPIAQGISAIDIALWDIVAKAQNKPLYQLWEGKKTSIPVYASALGPKDPSALVTKMQAQGVNAFKLKLGFGQATDKHNLELMRELIGSEAELMVDANQAWDVETTLEMAKLFEPFNITWLEEPIPADDWKGMATLRKELPFALAAGENIFSAKRFKALLDVNATDIAQPDVCKIGGLSDMREACLAAVNKGLSYAPHYLGGAVGLMASLQLFAGTPGGVVMELDPHPNPLREAFLEDIVLKEGHLQLPPSVGLGICPNESLIKKYLLNERSLNV